MGATELTRLDEGVLQISFNRPQSLNALHIDLVKDFAKALDQVEQDRDVRVVILTGEGRGFCAGFDLNGYGDDERLATLGPVRGLLDRQTEIADLVARLQALPVPVIGIINGPCAGAGLSFAAACDMRIAATTTVFSAAFLRAGVTPCDLGVSWLLPRIVGAGRAHELMYTGRRFDAAEAHAMGFVSHVVPVEELRAKALEMAEQIKQNPPLQTALTKSALAVAMQSGSLRDVVEFENRQQVLAAMTEDYREAIDSYLGKRAPRYANR